MSIKNREQFLTSIANRLGRSPSIEKPERIWQYSPQAGVLKDQSQDELVQVLIEQCANIHTTALTCTTAEELPSFFQVSMETYGGGTVIYSKDHRFEELGLASLLTHNPAMHEWDYEKEEANIKIAEHATISVL